MANKNKGLFGDLFDFDGDGNTTWNEALYASKIFDNKKTVKNNNTSSTKQRTSDHTVDPIYLKKVKAKLEKKYNVDLSMSIDQIENAWRDNCELGWEYGLDPYNFKSEKAYKQALEAAKNKSKQ